MERDNLSLSRLGLRHKAILVMAGALAVIMLAVGLAVYWQVTGQLKSSLEALGRELVKNVTSESLFDLIYEQKDKEQKRLQKFIRESKDLLYVIVVRPTPADKSTLGEAPYTVFASAFRRAGHPRLPDQLVEAHMATPGQVVEEGEFFGFTEKVQAGGGEQGEGGEDASGGDLSEAKTGSGGQQAPAADQEAAAEEEQLMFGEGGLEEEAAPAKAPEASRPAEDTGEQKAVAPAQSDTWGYVLLGLSTQSIQAQKNRLLWTLALVLLVALGWYYHAVVRGTPPAGSGPAGPAVPASVTAVMR